MLKSLTKLTELETDIEWQVQRRTRGQDVENSAGKTVQTWVVILSNKQGHKRFVPENRIWEFFKPLETAKED